MDTLQTLSEACRTSDAEIKQAALRMAYNVVCEQQQALARCVAFIERIGGDGYGGEHEYEVVLDAGRQALRHVWHGNGTRSAMNAAFSSSVGRSSNPPIGKTKPAWSRG